jgi:ATP-dependent Clp protease protease subunit
MDEETQQNLQYGTVCLVYHDEISLEKTKALMEICSNAVMQYGVQNLYFQFSSNGGSVDSAITLYNFLKSLPCQITMHNTGSIDSAAIVVFMAGDKRYAAAHTSFLFHGVGWGVNAGEIKMAQLKEMESGIEIAETKTANIVADNTNLSVAEIKGYYTQGESKSATFAKSKGIVSELKDVTLPKGTPIITVNSGTNG